MKKILAYFALAVTSVLSQGALAGGGTLDPSNVYHLTSCRGALTNGTDHEIFMDFYRAENGNEYVKLYQRDRRVLIQIDAKHGLEGVSNKPLDIYWKNPKISSSKNFSGQIRLLKLMSNGNNPRLLVRADSNDLDSFDISLRCQKGRGWLEL